MSEILLFKNELQRKLVHILSLIFPIVYLLTTYNIYISALGLSLIIILFVEIERAKNQKISKLFIYSFGSIVRSYEEKSFMNATYMLFSFFAISLIFNKDVAVMSMIITSLSDSFAAIFGIKYGSGSFFKNLGDNIIKDQFDLIISLVIE